MSEMEDEAPTRQAGPRPADELTINQGDRPTTSSLLPKLLQSTEFKNVAAWIHTRRQHGGVVPPLTQFHPQDCHLHFPTLSCRPFHDDRSAHPASLAEAVQLLETLSPLVRRELDGLRNKSGFQPFRGRAASRPTSSDGVGHLTHDSGDWSVFYLFAGAVNCSAQQEMCPRTTRMIRGIPRQCYSAFFSVIAPETHICAHCGPGNYRLRLHLGLHVPTGNSCQIRCADQFRSWSEGEVLVLDDSFEHEVWNHSSQPRVVLCVDVWHPDFSDAEVNFLERTLLRGDSRVVSKGDSLIAQVMAAYRDSENASLFAGLP